MTANDRASTWDRVSNGPLMVAALAFLAAYAIPIIWPAVPEGIRVACLVTALVVWAIFIADYAVRMWLAPEHLTYLRTHRMDLVVIVLPFLRFLRLLQMVSRLNDKSPRRVRTRILLYVLGAACLLGFVAALAALNVERGAPGANITTLGDALWWAVVSMTTTGYGDRYPVTGAGRLAGIALMIGGTVILGTVTAALFSWMSERVRHDVQRAHTGPDPADRPAPDVEPPPGG